MNARRRAVITRRRAPANGVNMSKTMSRKPHVTFYTKPGCHLCDEAKLEMARACCDDLFTFEEVNILSDPELYARYRTEIPVIAINGAEAFRHRLTADAFKQALRKEPA